jgi:hypothetical protein
MGQDDRYRARRLRPYGICRPTLGIARAGLSQPTIRGRAGCGHRTAHWAGPSDCPLGGVRIASEAIPSPGGRSIIGYNGRLRPDQCGQLVDAVE